MEITKVLKPFIRRGTQYFWQYSVYIYIYIYMNLEPYEP